MPQEELLQAAKNIIKLRWGKHKKEKLKTKVGFYLQAHFGKKVWTLKDLDDDQLKQVVQHHQNRLNKVPCCGIHPCK